jgi:hypothetical protein
VGEEERRRGEGELKGRGVLGFFQLLDLTFYLGALKPHVSS